MKIDVLTLFPDMFEGVLNESILKRAIDEKKVEKFVEKRGENRVSTNIWLCKSFKKR